MGGVGRVVWGKVGASRSLSIVAHCTASFHRVTYPAQLGAISSPQEAAGGPEKKQEEVVFFPASPCTGNKTGADPVHGAARGPQGEGAHR